MTELSRTLEKLLYIARFTSEYTALNFESRYKIKNATVATVAFGEFDDYLLCFNSSRSYANSISVLSKETKETILMVRVPPSFNLLLTDYEKRSKFFSTVDSSGEPMTFISETFINTRLETPKRIQEFFEGAWVTPENDYRLMEEDEYFMYTLTRSIPPFKEFKYITESISEIPKFEKCNDSIEIAVNAKNGVSEGLYNLNFCTPSIYRLCDKMAESFEYEGRGGFNREFILLK